MQVLQLQQEHVHGNSATATKLQSAKSITLNGAVSGTAKFDGSGDITITTTQANITVITGTADINAESGSTIEINYPSGLNKDNCVPIACGIGYGSNVLNYVGIFQDSMDMFLSGYKRTLSLTNDNIKLRIENPTTDPETATFSYKIVLMKIA